VLPLEIFFTRDEKTKFIPGEIRRSTQAGWIETSTPVGRAPIEIAVGTRRNAITLNFPDGTAKTLNDNNCLIEIMLPDGNRQGLALISNWRKIRPLNLGIGGLEKENDTGVVHLANWAEPAILAFIASEGSIGLFPADHEFPDRDLASLRATRSLLETDLLRLEKAAGPNSPSYERIKSRRQKFTEGNFIQAGAPWQAILAPKAKRLAPSWNSNKSCKWNDSSPVSADNSKSARPTSKPVRWLMSTPLYVSAFVSDSNNATH
ncbi:hypothetical protein EBR11_05380, partial [bacterium]|nr:hypothetical protein [bacterium]